MTRWRSTRRQRTTPSTARSGPVSTIPANSACCAADTRLGFPGRRLSFSAAGPRAFQRCTQSRNVCRSIPPDPGRFRPAHPVQHRRRSIAIVDPGWHPSSKQKATELQWRVARLELGSFAAWLILHATMNQASRDVESPNKSGQQAIGMTHQISRPSFTLLSLPLRAVA